MTKKFTRAVINIEGRKHLVSIHQPGSNFVYLGKESMKELIKLGLSGLEHNVLLYMMSEMEWETNIVRLSQAQIAKFLDTDPSVISRATKTLESADLIRPADRIGRTVFYRVNPFLAYRGSQSIAQAIAEDWKTSA